MNAGHSAGLAFTVFGLSLIGGVFLFCYLMHRFEDVAEEMLGKWWGLPTVLLGGTSVLVAGSLALSQVAWWLS